MRMPGVGPITALAIVATIDDAKQIRNLAAWLGLTPLNKSSGGKERLGRITKKGDRYIRKLLIVGMTSRALKPLPRRDMGEVAHPQHIRRGRVELAVHHCPMETEAPYHGSLFSASRHERPSLTKATPRSRRSSDSGLLIIHLQIW